MARNTMLGGRLVLHMLCVLAAVWSCSCEDELPGHMQPLGSHMEPLPVTTIDYMPTPKQFYEQFVKPKTPVLFQGLMSEEEVIHNWQSDQYLRNYFGDFMVSVEEGKKENRSQSGTTLTMNDFLDRYNEENIYMVTDISPEMAREWRIPKFVLCGGFIDHFMFRYLWFSSGGTKSVVHTDSEENLHCLISGQKRFVLIEPHYSDVIGPEHAEKGFYDIDVDQVDMRVYPRLAGIPWYQVLVNPGDCLYLPVGWIHNVNSVGRNMGLNIWFRTFEFDEEACPKDLSQLPNFSSMGEIEFYPELQLGTLFDMVKKDDGSIHAKDVYQLVTEKLGMMHMELEHIEKFTDILDPGCDGVIKNVKRIRNENLRKAFEYLADTEFMLNPDNTPQESDLPEEYYNINEFGGTNFEDDGDHVEDLDLEDLWEGPLSERAWEGGGDYQDQKHKDEL